MTNEPYIPGQTGSVIAQKLHWRHLNPRRMGLKLVAMLEGSKGGLVLLAGLGFLALVDADIQNRAVQLVQGLHLNPFSRSPEVFLNLFSRTSEVSNWMIAFDSLLYAGFRLVEAFGLWMHQQWAVWLGILTNMLAIPLSLYAVWYAPDWANITIVTINSLVVVTLMWITKS